MLSTSKLSREFVRTLLRRIFKKLSFPVTLLRTQEDRSSIRMSRLRITLPVGVGGVLAQAFV